jgi:DNA polymerase III sliding clamp (beta) subunit (PCNA family)
MKAEFLTTNLKTAVKALKDGLKAAGLKTRDYDRIKVQLQAPSASALYFILNLTPSVPVRVPANVLDGVAHAEALQFDNAGALLKALDAALKAAGKAGKLRLSGAPVAAGSTTTLGIADATTPDSDTGTELGEAVCIGGSNVLPTALKEAEAYWEVEVSALDLWRALHIEVAAAKDDHRPALTALYAGIEDGALTFAAADGYRLMVYSIPAERVAVTGGTKHTAQALIPAVAAGVWLGKLKALIKADKRVTLRLEDGGTQTRTVIDGTYGRSAGLRTREVTERIDRVVLRGVGEREALGMAQALDHRFPPFRNVIPKNYHLRVEAETGSLMQAAKLAEIFARDNAYTCRVKMDVNGSSEMGLGTHGLMTVSGKSQERGDVLTEVRAEFPDRWDNHGMSFEPVDYSCNVVYLLDMCKQAAAWKCPNVTMEVTKADQPVVFRYSARPEALGVLMPMSR